MAFETKTLVGSDGIPYFQSVDHTLRGGAVLDDSFSGDTVKAGTAVYVDEQTRIAEIETTEGDPSASNANGLVLNEVKNVEGNVVDVVIAGIVYEERIPAQGKTEEVKAALPTIIYSKSK